MSKSIHDLIPGGAHTYSKGDDQFSANAPRFFERGDGAYVWDDKGNKFLDWTMGLRTVTLGYGYKPVIDAAIGQMWKGSNFGRPSRIEGETAEDLLSLVPRAEMVKFAKNGSNVTTAAVKLARAYTNRDLVAICSDHPFFSFDDWFIGSTPCDAGIPQSTKELTVGFRYNDLDSVECIFRERGNEVACLIMEAATSEPPRNNFLQSVRELCRKHGAVFILDEMITGFRWHNGGAQAYFDIDPDLSTFGKAMGNGFAMAAVVGKREIMELGGLRRGTQRVFLLSATHGAENHALAAAREVIRTYREQPVIEQIWRAGRDLIAGLNAAAHEAGMGSAFHAFGYPCSPYFACMDKTGAPSASFRTLFLQEMVRNGVIVNYIAPSIAHQAQEVEKTVEAARASFSIYTRALNDGADKYLDGPPIKPVFRTFN
jgi:glutamate-1-semialdehyde 2,1-aminomutase